MASNIAATSSIASGTSCSNPYKKVPITANMPATELTATVANTERPSANAKRAPPTRPIPSPTNAIPAPKASTDTVAAVSPHAINAITPNAAARASIPIASVLRSILPNMAIGAISRLRATAVSNIPAPPIPPAIHAACARTITPTATASIPTPRVFQSISPSALRGATKSPTARAIIAIPIPDRNRSVPFITYAMPEKPASTAITTPSPLSSSPASIPDICLMAATISIMAPAVTTRATPVPMPSAALFVFSRNAAIANIIDPSAATAVNSLIESISARLSKAPAIIRTATAKASTKPADVATPVGLDAILLIAPVKAITIVTIAATALIIAPGSIVDMSLSAPAIIKVAAPSPAIINAMFKASPNEKSNAVRLFIKKNIPDIPVMIAARPLEMSRSSIPSNNLIDNTRIPMDAAIASTLAGLIDSTKFLRLLATDLRASVCSLPGLATPRILSRIASNIPAIFLPNIMNPAIAPPLKMSSNVSSLKISQTVSTTSLRSNHTAPK